MKHTKGPWINLGNGDIVARSEDFCGGEKDIASVFLTSNDEDEANAHLIAAAPDLLEALQSAERAMSNKHFAAEVLAHDSIVREMIRAAIANATGSAA